MGVKKLPECTKILFGIDAVQSVFCSV